FEWKVRIDYIVNWRISGTYIPLALPLEYKSCLAKHFGQHNFCRNRYMICYIPTGCRPCITLVHRENLPPMQLQKQIIEGDANEIQKGKCHGRFTHENSLLRQDIRLAAKPGQGRHWNGLIEKLAPAATIGNQYRNWNINIVGKRRSGGPVNFTIDGGI